MVSWFLLVPARVPGLVPLPYFSLLSFLRKGNLFHYYFLVPSGSGYVSGTCVFPTSLSFCRKGIVGGPKFAELQITFMGKWMLLFGVHVGEMLSKCLKQIPRFDNHKVDLNGNVAIAMGNYYFTSAADGSKTKVEYTFGYKKTQDGKVRIFLHHSSVPFSTQPESVSMEEVKAAQKAWAEAIKRISKTYLDGGDYLSAAANAAGELYGYGHGNVLFKPTKAKDVQFRPEASQAMSYFVGAKNVKQADGIAEDAGFAINGGAGWSHVELPGLRVFKLICSFLMG